MRILRTESFQRAQLQKVPFVWARVEDLFCAEAGLELAESFPKTGFRLVSGSGGGKRYRYKSRCLLATGGRTFTNALSGCWADLISDLAGSDYRQALSNFIGVDLSKCELEVTAHLYAANAHLDPHTDLVEKVATHVLYFNEVWDCRSGGCVQILKSGNIHDAAASIQPLVGSSVVLVRSEDSWHAVPGVQTANGEIRRSVTATFLSPGLKAQMWNNSGKLKSETLATRSKAILRRSSV